MGVAISKYTDLSSNDYLIKFCSADVICANDPFWNQMLSFNITPPNNAEEQLMFDSSTETLLQRFLQNNPQTGNLGALVQVFITRASVLLSSPNADNVMLAWQAYNALFVIRAVIKYLVEMVQEYELCKHLDAQPEVLASLPVRTDIAEPPPTPESGDSLKPTETEMNGTRTSPKMSGESRVEMLVDTLIGLIVDVPVTDNTYYLHLECINSLLVLMSVYMFAGVHGQTRLLETSMVYRTIFLGRYQLHGPLLVRKLTQNYCELRAAPAHMFGVGSRPGSLLIDLASGLWNMLSFSSTVRRTIITHPPLDRQELLERLKMEHPLSNQSCLLLLALSNHCMNDDNLYRNALLHCQDTQDNTDNSSTTSQKEANGNSLQMTPPRIDIAALHKTICTTASCEHSTLLLYLMLHSCDAYRRHLTQDPNIENMIVPILQVLYNAADNNSHHIYMSLIVLLILTEDDVLIKNVHLITLKNPAWYTERTLSEVSLGGLMVLVIVRALHYNMARVRDKYLHTNCLAAIANMSSEFRNLHPYVAQRLLSLFETLTKRRTRLVAEIEGGNLDLPHQSEEKTEEIMDHISVLDEVLRMLLEIINSCLSHQLANNLHMVYALLHKRTLFQQHQQHHVAQNIEMVIGYFSTRLQRVQENAGRDLSVDKVLACIKKGAEQWSSDRLKKFPDLKFRYVEEEKPEEFFTPYVWGLISNCGGIYWASECGARAIGDLLV